MQEQDKKLKYLMIQMRLTSPIPEIDVAGNMCYFSSYF